MLGLFCMVSIGASAFEVDGICYDITSSTTCEVAVKYPNYSGVVNIPANVSYSGKTFSVTSIGWSAFGSCSGLTSAIIGNSVTSIGNYTFYGCSGLTSVTNLATEPQQISDDTFIIYGTLHVLKGYKDVYAATDVWKNFTIVDDAEDPTGIEEIIDNGKLIIDNSSVFDLQGKRVERMKQGEVYIRDGRKFIAK